MFGIIKVIGLTLMSLGLIFSSFVLVNKIQYWGYLSGSITGGGIVISSWKND